MKRGLPLLWLACLPAYADPSPPMAAAPAFPPVSSGVSAGQNPGNAIKDPTIEPKRFRDAWKQMVPGTAFKGGAGSAGKPKVPEIRLLGKILGPGRPPTALLQIEKQTYVAQQGSQISVLTQSKDLVTLRVESVGPAGVGLLLLPSGERLNLN